MCTERSGGAGGSWDYVGSTLNSGAGGVDFKPRNAVMPVIHNNSSGRVREGVWNRLIVMAPGLARPPVYETSWSYS
jgi:hypothetical protein